MSTRPRSRRVSISSPARNSRNASPNSARICTGRSTCNQPSTDGPSTIPATISRTTDGMRSQGRNPTSRGAATATAQMMSRLVNETSGMPAAFGEEGEHLRRVGVAEFAHRAGGAEGLVPERSGARGRRADVRVRLVDVGVARRYAEVDVVEADADVEVFRPQDRRLIGG